MDCFNPLHYFAVGSFSQFYEFGLSCSREFKSILRIWTILQSGVLVNFTNLDYFAVGSFSQFYEFGLFCSREF